MLSRPGLAVSLLTAVLLTAAMAATRAEETAPDASTLLFDEPQLAGTRPGDALVYRYTRRIADEAKFGPGFEDQIRLSLDKGDGDATRTVDAEVFSGARRRPAGPFPSMSGNPVLSLMLEQNIEGLSKQLGGNPRYFKTAIRTALREKAVVVAESLSVGGRSEPGYRVTIAPFKDDPNKARMLGLDTLTYEFEVAKAVPGEIVQIRISAPAATGGPLFEERIDYVPQEP